MPAHLPAPSAEAEVHSRRVVDHVVRAVETAGGWIGFDRYMDLALYAPGLGYYSAGTHKLGDVESGGDFVTAPEISPLFAQSLAAQVEQVFATTAHQIVEFGAGSGRLARDLLEALAERGVTVERYAIVEVSADLRQRQRDLLADASPGRPAGGPGDRPADRLAGGAVEWLDAPPPAFDGVIVANEVVDVLPVRLFARRAGVVHERGVVARDGALEFDERRADPSLSAAVESIAAQVGPWPNGYGSELGEVARAWTASLGDWLVRGVALLIDYGFPRREYYHAQRLMGTLMCHYRHRAHADPLWLPGLNDITAHVDFTALADAAHGAGLDILGYTTQAHFLMNCGILDLLRAAGHDARTTAGAQRLLSEAEMGELFKVLAIGRGVDVGLMGFARGDRRHTL